MYIFSVFENLTENEKVRAVMLDGVYIKKVLLFHGGSVIGKAVNNPIMLPKSVGVMVECLHGSPVFLSKMLLVTK